MPANSGDAKMDPTVGNLIGVGIGAFVTLVGVFLSNCLLMRKEREQWDREHKAEQEKWLRDRLQEIYSNCIYYLEGRAAYAYVAPNFKGYVSDTSELEQEKLRLGYEQLKLGYDQMEYNVHKLKDEFDAERQRWLNLLTVHHPFRGTIEFDDFLTKRRDGKLRVVDVTELSARES